MLENPQKFGQPTRPAASALRKYLAGMEFVRSGLVHLTQHVKKRGLPDRCAGRVAFPPVTSERRASRIGFSWVRRQPGPPALVLFSGIAWVLRSDVTLGGALSLRLGPRQLFRLNMAASLRS